MGLSLRAAGFGSSLRTLAAVAPRAAGNRIIYPHGGLSETYANGPLGLEQGFTIARAPAQLAAGPLTLAIAFSGNASASLLHGAQGISFSPRRAPGAEL